MLYSLFMKRIGLLGAGTVGSSLAQLITARPDLDLVITKALVKDISKKRAGLDKSQLTTNPQEVLDNSDILVEVMGGTGLAAELMLQSLQNGKAVVSANKAALAERWNEFLPFMQAGNLYFEAAVMVGTPAIDIASHSLRGSNPIELHAILNGTCNYILNQLENGVDYQTALDKAQELGYAEADPSLDVGGYDAAHKLNILARLLFDPNISWSSVSNNTSGISHLSPKIMANAIANNGRIRLIASVFPEDGAWKAAVRTVFLANEHPMASTASNRNALYFRGDACGEIIVTGAGAGGAATASGVLADIIQAMNNIAGPSPLAKAMIAPKQNIKLLEVV